MASRYAVSMDVGETFTDFLQFDLDPGSTVSFHKVLTDAEQPAGAVVQGWQKLVALGGISSIDVEYVIHSTTLVDVVALAGGVKPA